MAQGDLQIIQENASVDFVQRVLTGVTTGKVFIIDGSNLPSLRALTESDITNLTSDLAAKINSSLIGAASGVCPLGSDSKVSTTYLPATILGAAIYQGTWNATTNSPTIPAAASGNKGQYYVVATAGTTNVDGITDWKIGDWIISNGSAWQKVDNTDAVLSVNGYTGAVSLVKGDIGLGNVDNLQQMPLTYLDTDNGLSANSDTKVPSQKAVKYYIDNHVGGVSFVSVPASSSSSGVAGQIAYDDDYFYTCVATNKWKRSIMATW